MRGRVILIALVLGLATLPASQGGYPIEVEGVGVVFGGLTLDANNSGNATSSLADLPAVVEYYTATWCANCVDVEHALDDIEADGVNLQQFHFHRDQDNEDPWGTPEGEERWDERYDGGVAPTVVFNGSVKKIGSISESDTLQEDYTALAQNDLGIGVGSSSMTWQMTDNNSGNFSWNIIHDENLIPEGGDLVNMLWISERFANFPDGSNGVEDYPHVIKALINLGNQSMGTINVVLPEAHDGNDLQLHLLHQIILPEPVNETEPEGTEPEETNDDGQLSSISLIATLSVVMIAAFTVQRKLQ